MNLAAATSPESEKPAVRRRAAVVLVFDRLQPAFLGPYGGTACETPACNRLAAEGYVAEQCYADASELESIYLSYWSGKHALQRAGHFDEATDASPAGRSLAEQLEAAGVHTELFSDDPRVASHRWAEGFGNRLAIDHGTSPAESDTAGAMRVAQVLAAAAERWEQIESPALLWLHAAAWDDAWDAPYEFRQQWADPEDPAPPTFNDPPRRFSPSTIDHDEVLGYVQAYVGQVAAWDACLDAFLESLNASPLADDTLLIVTSPRGYPLGEHGRVGDVPPALFNELLQQPLFIRFPRGTCPLVRDQGLVQPADLYATLLDWFNAEAEPEVEADIELDTEPDVDDTARFASQSLWGRSLLPRVQSLPDMPRRIAAATTPGQLAVRTPHWLLRIVEADGAAPNRDARLELYVKPDDRWEANEVSSRCESDLQKLRSLADAIRLGRTP